jgi:glycosyltransferase involved in cell wall biosynthesis
VATFDYRLTIIVPVYNVEPYLKECLASLLSQLSAQVELIIIDDCSTDSSYRIASENCLGLSDNVILLRNDENVGLGQTRNKGIDIAKGEYIAFVDSDDWVRDGYVDSILSNANGADIIHYGCFKYKENIEGPYYNTELTPSSDLNSIKKNILSKPNYAWLKVVKKQLIHDNELRFSRGYYEDVEWNIKLVVYARSIVAAKSCFYIYRQRKGSIVSSKNTNHLDLLYAYMKSFEWIKAKQKLVNKRVERQIGGLFIESMYYLYRQREDRFSNFNYKEFCSQYSRTLIEHKIFSFRPRYFAMLVITVVYSALRI